MVRILISKCLLGTPCRYDGESRIYSNIEELKKSCVLIPVCPEQMGNLPTPRCPCEIIGDRVVMKSGQDVTNEYCVGAQTVLFIAKICKADFAVLKSLSPSCGKDIIYDGTFSKTKTIGSGIAAKLLMDNGFEVFTENETDKILNKIRLMQK